MVSAGYSGLKVSPASGFFVCCIEPQTHEYSRSLGRLLGRAAAVSAIYERIERMGSSTKEARCLTRILVKVKATDKLKSTTDGDARQLSEPMLKRLDQPCVSDDIRLRRYTLNPSFYSKEDSNGRAQVHRK